MRLKSKFLSKKRSKEKTRMTRTVTESSLGMLKRGSLNGTGGLTGETKTSVERSQVK